MSQRGLLTSRKLRNESQIERRKVYAALLSESFALVDIAYSFVVASDRFALVSDVPVNTDGIFQEVEAARSRLEEVVGQESRSRTALRARQFEVQLIALKHLSDMAYNLVAATLVFALTMKDHNSDREKSSGDAFHSIVGAFTALARWDADSPGSWVVPKLVVWRADRRRVSKEDLP